MIQKKVKNYQTINNPLTHFINSLSIIEDSDFIKVSRDIDDDKFIECAFNCKAIYIISGDKDLLDVKIYKCIKIIKVDEFLKIVQKVC